MAVSLEEALASLLEKVTLCKPVSIPLEECYNLVLAEDITSALDFPPFDRSPLDGYAVRADDVLQASFTQPTVLRQVDNIPAGSWPSTDIQPGMAARIMTGAKIPEGADAVIRLEDTSVQGDLVSIYSAAGARNNICKQGEEIRRGAIVLKKGTVLKEGALGLLAMLGQAAPLVYRQPKVAILATGSEIVGVNQPLGKGKIRNSNSYMLMAKVREAGGIPLLLGHVQDDVGEIHKRLTSCGQADMYITTGGASVGDYDLMAQLFKKMDIPLLYSRLAIKPGMPVLAGLWQDALLVALSGNPAAANVSFEVLLRPAIKRMAGAVNIGRTISQARLKSSFHKPITSRRFIFARCEWIEGRLYAEPIGFQGNGMLSGLLQANALIDVAPNGAALEAGTDVIVRLLTE